MAFSANYNKSSKKNPTIKLNEGKDAVFGIYLAEVVSTKDTSRTGRVRVFIPAISKDKNSTAGYFDAIWTSPFAGSTDPRTVGNDIHSPEESMSSYGLWATVPDNGNLVLVAFGDGNTKYPLVISCLFPDKFNQMIPGQAGNKSYQAPGMELPTVEKNKRTQDINHNDTYRPIQHTLAEGIVRQGLANDPIRGAGRASARRESPSEVFGLLTPGPRDPQNFNNRLGGHQFIMDDNLGSRQVRIRTAQGTQLLMDDTSGCIYMINRDGTVWMEFAPTGDVFLYGEGDINLRAKKNFNLRADGDVNIEAGQNVNIKAAKDHDGAKYIGEGGGAGGEVKIQAKADLHAIAEFNTFQTSLQGETHLNSAGSFYNTSGNEMNVKAAEGIKHSAGKVFSAKAGSDVIFTSGGQIVEKASKILMNSGGADAPTPTESTVAVPKTPTNFDDQPAEQPGYDRESDSPVTTSGLRSGDGASIATVCSVVVTAEPFVGHGIPDPAKDDQGLMAPDESISSSLPANSNGVTAGPADVNSPSGFSAGSYNNEGSPVYSSPATLANNFTLAQNKRLQEGIVADISNSLTSSIPPVRSPRITPQGARALGINGKLNNLMAQSQNLAFDLQGAPIDLQRAEVASMKNVINAASQMYSDPALRADTLLQQGIQTFEDGGSTIYVSSNGNKIIDFSGGLGDTSLQMLTQSNLLNTSNVVKQLVVTPISDNQMKSLISFADHIGPENFAKSKVMQAVNSGNFAAVPNLMLAHSKLQQGGKNVLQQDYYQRRQFEGELFQTPDAVPIPKYSSRVPFSQQAKDLATLRKNLLA